MTQHYMLLSPDSCHDEHCTCSKADLHHIAGQLKLQTRAAHSTVYMTLHYMLLSSVVALTNTTYAANQINTRFATVQKQKCKIKPAAQCKVHNASMCMQDVAQATKLRPK